jgi:CheY-like chemotaxis protein
VLYIEDNLSNLRLTEQILSHRPGIRLLSAMQGQLGLELARAHTPDLILLDLQLPDLTGVEVLRRLREEPRTEHIPIIVVSADATPGQMARLRAAGAHDYLTKPLQVRKLLAVLDEHALGSRRYAERNHSE